MFDAAGRLNAVLDISALSSPQPKASQHLALQLVKVYANHIENAAFLHRFSQEWILRLSAAPQFLDVNPEYLLAIDANGRVIGHNRRAQRLLETDARTPLLGRAFDRIFDASFNDLGRFVHTRPSDQRAVHLASRRRGALVPVNCGALPAGLVESELFGHKKGAFSGALADAPGLVAASSGGTLFLDEIGDLPLPAQAALLRVLEEHEVRAVGAMVPPGTVLAAAAARALFAYAWPRNVRELARTLERALALAGGGELGVAHLPDEIAKAPWSAPTDDDGDQRRVELIALLEKHRGNISKVAAEMGRVRQQIQRWLKRYGLDPERYR